MFSRKLLMSLAPPVAMPMPPEAEEGDAMEGPELAPAMSDELDSGLYVQSSVRARSAEVPPQPPSTRTSTSQESQSEPMKIQVGKGEGGIIVLVPEFMIHAPCRRWEDPSKMTSG